MVSKDKTLNSAGAAVERTAMAIRVIKGHSAILANESEQMANWLDNIDEAFRVLRETDSSDAVRTLHERIDRLRELRNMMELGSFQIQANRAMDEAWQRLP
jgi:limonene-1,2-epoxide hydrolase